jgi:hypothetical protein
MKMILFLGSGISFESGLPNAEQITDILLKEAWYKGADNNFYHGEQADSNDLSSNISHRLQKFLTILKEFADEYLRLRMNPTATYEDLFYLCQQIFDNQDSEIENPAIKPNTVQLTSRIASRKFVVGCSHCRW